jgi:hypothetical protein
MRRAIAIALLTLTATALPAAAAPRAATNPAAAPRPNVAAILVRSGVDEGPLLKDLVGTAGPPAPADDGAARYAEARAALRACHAERYATARDNVLAGRAAPLGAC